jgi:hypothetical protein
MENYQGRVLVYLLDEGIFERGEIVYCFQEDEFMFRVNTRRLIHGVQQVNFPVESKHKFRIIQ